MIISPLTSGVLSRYDNIQDPAKLAAQCRCLPSLPSASPHHLGSVPDLQPNRLNLPRAPPTLKASSPHLPSARTLTIHPPRPRPRLPRPRRRRPTPRRPARLRAALLPFLPSPSGQTLSDQYMAYMRKHHADYYHPTQSQTYQDHANGYV
jgi:hypothetical protein